MVSEYSAGHSEKPQPRFFTARYVAYSTPGDEVDLGEQVGGVLAIRGSPKKVRKNRNTGVSVNLLEPGLVFGLVARAPAHFPASGQLTR